jgi:hypothetical protein
MNEENINIERADLLEGVELVTGKSYHLKIGPPMGILAGYLFDQDMVECLPDYSYTIYEEKKKVMEGTTDKNGFFMHKDIPAGYYRLNANKKDHMVVTIQKYDFPPIICVLGEMGDLSTPS